MVWVGERCQAKAERCRAYYAAQETRLFGFSVEGNAAEQEAINAACEPDSYLCRLFSAANLPAWLLVLAGAVTFGAIWFQAVKTRDAADATRDNANALLAQNRPWVFLARESTIPTSPPSDWKFEWVLKNYGKTPARIIWLRVEAQIGTSDAKPPDASVFGEPSYSFPFMLPTDGDLRNQDRLPEPWAGDDIITEKRHLWLCGYVIYSDATEQIDSRSYETAFCFVYQKALGIRKACWRRSGPREYNRTT